ncbi:MAG: amidohydrolase family protein, partial [Planctomycetes bacterium]|nr:amidohydrolase family protein [Planctomycetota bacterium]
MKKRTRGIPSGFSGCFTIAVLAFVPLASGEFETPIAITNVTIVIEPGTTVENGTILIADGRIIEAGENVTIPSHAELIDGKGLIAYPGLIDGQTFLGIPEDKRETAVRERAEDVNPDRSQQPLPATRFANRRGIRPHFRAASLFAADEDAIKAHRSGGFAGALIAPRDGILSGTSAFVNLSGAPLRRSILETDVAMHGSFRTGEEGDYPGTLLGMFAQFRQVMLDAGRHTKVQEFARRHSTSTDRPPVDETLDAIQPLLRRSQRLFFEANSENEIRRALDLAGEFNLDVGITGAKEAWKVIDRIKAENIPLIVSLKFDDEPDYGKKKKAGDKKKPESSEEAEDEPTGEESEKEAESKSDKKAGKKKDEKKIYEPLRARKERRRLWEEQVANIIRLHEAGIEFSLSTRDFKKPAKLLENLRLVIERGLPVDAALAALTRTPASLFGLGNQLGRIEVGQLANIVVMSKSFEDDKAKVKYIFVDGKKFDYTGDDDKDKKKDEPEKDEADEDEESAESEEIAEAETEEEDQGPSWRCEIEADRVPKTRTGGNVLIQNATVITVSGPILENTSILVQDGKIAAVGPDLTAPA